jgi:predicted MFS family arabinose efflux permease
MPRQLPIVATLGTTQTLAWASTYYLPAMLAESMSRDLGVTTPTVFAAFSVALIVSALLGPYSGGTIDKLGGRSVLMGSNLVFAMGLVGLALSHGSFGLFASWMVIGLGMGCGLYEAAFASLVRIFGSNSRSAITGITLIAGFASTVGWPLSTYLETQIGWRGACLTWAGLHIVLGLPLNALLPKVHALAAATKTTQQRPEIDQDNSAPTWTTTVALSFVFAATWFISTAMATHLPTLLQLSGATLGTAVLVGSLIGPAQVGARLLDFLILRQMHPLVSARIAAALHPVGVAAFMLLGTPAAAIFGILHGAGNGILTIAKGTLPLAFFGSIGYGHRQGVLMIPARVAQALAPWLFGLFLQRWGVGALWVSAGLSFLAFTALMLLPAGRCETD